MKHYMMSVPGLMLVALLAIVTSGCSGENSVPRPASAPAPVSVKAASVERGPISLALSYPGNVQARAQVPIVPEVAGRITRLAVDVGSEVKMGDVIAEIDPSSYELQLAQAQAALAAAEAKVAAMVAGSRPEQIALARANLYAAQERLTGMQAGGRAEQVAQAQANLEAAEARLERARKGATPEQIAAAEAQVRLAHNNEYYQQQQADAIGTVIGALPGDADRDKLKHAQLGIAWEQSRIAEAQLAQLLAGTTQEELRQLESAVEAARQQLEFVKKPYATQDLAQAETALVAAEQQLSLAQAPFTANELNAARAGVDQARAVVELARLQLQKTSITAPIDGLVAQRMLSVGAMVSSSPISATPIVVLVSQDVEVTINVEEARLGLLRLGLPVELTVAAYPGETFAAQVAAIAPAVDAKSRTVPVKIRPQLSGKLIEGMFAQVSMVVAEEAQALLVPNVAVREDGEKKVVFLHNDGVASRREIKVGLASGGRVQVLEGLAEGDEVVIDGVDGLRDGQALSVRR
jgi:HlyD family secretion protein